VECRWGRSCGFLIRPIRPERLSGACVEIEEVVLSREWKWVDVPVVVVAVVSGRDCASGCDGWRNEVVVVDIVRSDEYVQGRNRTD
jgi:hypothetical protein